MHFFAIIIAYLVAVWVFEDSKKRYPQRKIISWAWAIGTFLFMIVFLPLYLILRPKKDEEEKSKELPQEYDQSESSIFCTKCGNKLNGSDVFCSNCGAKHE